MTNRQKRGDPTINDYPLMSSVLSAVKWDRNGSSNLQVPLEPLEGALGACGVGRGGRKELFRLGGMTGTTDETTPPEGPGAREHFPITLDQPSFWGWAFSPRSLDFLQPNGVGTAAA